RSLMAHRRRAVDYDLTGRYVDAVVSHRCLPRAGQERERRPFRMVEDPHDPRQVICAALHQQPTEVDLHQLRAEVPAGREEQLHAGRAHGSGVSLRIVETENTALWHISVPPLGTDARQTGMIAVREVVPQPRRDPGPVWVPLACVTSVAVGLRRTSHDSHTHITKSRKPTFAESA